MWTPAGLECECRDGYCSSGVASFASAKVEGAPGDWFGAFVPGSLCLSFAAASDNLVCMRQVNSF